MRVYFDSPPEDRAIARINLALTQYATKPINVTKNRVEAELVIIHVVGRRDRVARLTNLVKSQNQKYAIIQHSLRRTLSPSTKSWLEIWQGARLVCSFLDLKSLCREDSQAFNFNFYHTPWGVESDTFKPRSIIKKFVIATSGPDYLTESVREAVKAAREVGKPVFHVGRELNLGEDVVCSKGMDDDVLASYYSECEFVSGLRRFEGFELPAVEGLLCGARPIMFDKPHYRTWFNDFSVFIPENSRAEVIKSLIPLFHKGAKPVTISEIVKAREIFNWNKIISGFWNHIDI